MYRWKHMTPTVQFSLVALILSGIFGVARAEDQANVPDIISQTGKQTQSGDQSADKVNIADLHDKRRQAETELATVSRPGMLGKDAPPGVSQEDLLARRALLQQVVRGYGQQIDEYQRLEQARERHQEIIRTSTEWKGFDKPPPYSILLADDLWNTMFSLRLVVEGIQSQLTLMEFRFTRARESLRAADERVRQASERLEATKDPAEAARAQWGHQLQELRKRAASVMLTAADISRKRIEEELAEARVRLAFAQRQFESADEHVTFTEEDLKKIRARASQERQALEGELEQTAAELYTHSQALEEAQRQLEAQVAGPSSTGSSDKFSAKMVRMKRAVELKRIRAENTTLKGDLLKQLIDIVEGERQLWESRFAIARGTEPEKAREAYREVKPLFNNIQASRDYLHQQVAVVSGQLSEQENRLDNATLGEDRAQVQATLDAYRQRQTLYNRVLERLDQASRLVERWNSEFKEQRKELPLSARLQDWAKQVSGSVKTLWDFEIFAAEDTIEIDGKKITGRRSVTVGKVVSALAILVVGYWICLYLARLIGRLAVKRLGAPPEVANLVRQWAQAFLVTVLIFISLISVKIPLTIFAFLGGAFAIGVGFGAQNLLKNVISGMLLLIERPLRVGDLIEVDNIRGRVITIGLRSSTVRDAKGVETLIPNSNFLDRNLTNWTYSSQIGRFSMSVGAPYGSSTHQVRELLIDIAGQHPRVLKIPQPQALLEGFGDKAVIFSMNYWLDIRLNADPGEVASELRFMIEQRFTEAGLKVLPAG